MIQVDVASLGLGLLPYPDKNPAGFHTSTRAEQLRPWVSAVRLSWPLPCPLMVIPATMPMLLLAASAPTRGPVGSSGPAHLGFPVQ